MELHPERVTDEQAACSIDETGARKFCSKAANFSRNEVLVDTLGNIISPPPPP